MKNKDLFHSNILLTKTYDDKTCYELHEIHKVPCKKSDCRQWIDSKKCHNCVLISAKNGSKTLQEIGDIYGITRMRICQIEKNAIRKLLKKRNYMDF
jgi:DNA-directed RNA polymerase specialized sigma subunit